MKKLLFGFGLPLILFGFVKFANASTLILSPASGSFTSGQTFTVDINLNTAGAAVDGVDLFYLRYPSNILEVQDSNAGTAGVQIAPGTLFSQTLTNIADAATGRITFSAVTTGGTTYNGSGKLATITFKAVGNGTAAVTFDFSPGSTSDTNVAGAGADTLTSVTNGSYTVSGVTTPPPPPPTPTPPPTPPTTPPPVTPPPTTPPPPPTGGTTVLWTHYPSGTIFKYANNATVYIKEGDLARPITSWSVYVNQVPGARSIIVIPDTVTFSQGPVLGLRSGTLIKASNDPTVYLVAEGKRVAFSSAQEFFNHNYNFSNVYSIDDIPLVNSIPMSTDPFVRPYGTLFKYASSPAVYFLNSARTKRGYTTIEMFNIWNATLKDVVVLPATETYPDGAIANLPNGIAVKGSSATIYFVYDGVLRPFNDMNLFTSMGLTNAMVKTFSDADIALHTIGNPM